MKNNSTKIETEDMVEFARFVRDAGRKPGLTTTDKKQILADILPRRSYLSVWAPAYAMCAGLVIIVGIFGFVHSARPGENLYKVLRTTEDIRSKVQPSFDEKLVERRDNEISALIESGAPESKVQIVETEKKAIEDRIQARSKDPDTIVPTTASPKSNDTKLKSVDSTTAPKQTDTKTQEKKKSSDITEAQKKAAEKAVEDCKDALEARKEKGEKITSDQYKLCESNLPRY
jgi:hypothetical protein